MSSPACPSPEELSVFLLGKIDDAKAESITSHIDMCDRCQNAVQTLDISGDTLVTSLLSAGEENSFEVESACREAVSLVGAIGREPSFATQKALDAPSQEQPDLGQVGPYRFLAKLGQGGMGTVYKALHTKLKRVVAVKVLSADRMRDQYAIARFEREMEAVGKLDHANIVRASDADEQDGMHYLVMEYVEGCDLSKLVQRSGPLPVDRACELIRQAADGLDHAHQNGLVHRDIKPSNLMINQRGQVKILDLGLALLQNLSEEDSSADHAELTSTGQTMGTVDYMAPEQCGDSHQVDIRADIYSLGATLYKLLSGRAPLANRKRDTILKKLLALAKEDPQPITEIRPDVPAQLATILHRMLAKRAADRLSTPAEVAQALAPFAAGADMAALLAPMTEPAPDSKELSPSATSLPTITSSSGDTDDPTRVAEITQSNDELEPVADSSANSDLPVIQVTPSATLKGNAKPKTRRASPTAKWIAVGVSIAALLTLAVIFTIKTPYGTIVVEAIEGQDVKVVVMKDGREVDIIDADGHWEAQLREGQYEVRLKGGGDRYELDRNSVTISRDGQQRVKITLKKPPTVISAFDPGRSAPDPDRLVAQWLLKFAIKDKYDTIEIVTDKNAYHSPRPGEPLPREKFFIHQIRIHSIELDDEFLAKLAPLSRLTHLYLRGPKITDAGLAHLSRLEMMFNLNLDGTSVTDKGLAEISSLPRLNIFELPNIPITEKMLGQIGRMERLTHLGLASTDLRGAGLTVLSNLSGLTNFSISGVSDDDLVSLRQWPKLKNVFLDSSAITDRAIVHLKSLRTLEVVTLKNTQVTSVGMAELQKALPNCKIYWDGKPDPNRRAAQWVLANGGVVSLGPGRGVKSLDQLPDEPFKLWAVYLDDQKSVTDADLQQLKGVDNLRHLKLGNTSVGDATLLLAGKMKYLEVLSVLGTQVTDAGLAHLTELENLRLLHLIDTDITDEGLKSLAKIPSLTALTLQGTRVTNDGLAHLKPLKNLISLTLVFTAVDDGGVSLLLDLPALTNLQLEGTALTDAGVAQLSGMPALTTLNLRRTKITDAALVSLKELKNLTSLNLQLTKVTDAGVAELQKALPQCKIIR